MAPILSSYYPTGKSFHSRHLTAILIHELTLCSLILAYQIYHFYHFYHFIGYTFVSFALKRSIVIRSAITLILPLKKVH